MLLNLIQFLGDILYIFYVRRIAFDFRLEVVQHVLYVQYYIMNALLKKRNFIIFEDVDWSLPMLRYYNSNSITLVLYAILCSQHVGDDFMEVVTYLLQTTHTTIQITGHAHTTYKQSSAFECVYVLMHLIQNLITTM